jgi:hypothetical protein
MKRSPIGEFFFTATTVVMGLGMLLGVLFVPLMLIWTVFNLGLLALTMATPWAWAMFAPSAIAECAVLIGTMIFSAGFKR